MRFKVFINETGELGKVPIARAVSREEIDEFFKKNPIALKNLNTDVKLFRGFPGESDFLLGNSSLFKRRAANTTNFVNIYLSTIPSWKNFPSREHAYIGSTTHYGASGFGLEFAMFPADDAKIGVCPTDDFWNAFEYKTGKIVSTINANLRRMALACDVKLDEDNGAVLRHQLEQITIDILIKKYDERMTGEWVNHEINRMKKEEVNNLSEYLDWMLDPKDFHVIGPAEIHNHLGDFEEREVLVEGKVAFIKFSELKNYANTNEI